MPRWPEKKADPTVTVTATVETKDGGSEEIQVAPVKKSMTQEFIPYTGKEDLPPYRVTSTKKDGKKTSVALSDARFILARGERKSFKLIGIFRSQRGVIRKLYTVIRPTLKNRPNDKALFEKLKAAKIPGAF